MTRPILALALAAVALSTGGCRDIAHFVWPCTPPRCPGAATRETPEAAVEYLVAAFHDRRVGDLYFSLHPDFVAENGRFSAEEFSLAYDHWESEFAADAATLAAAKVTRRGEQGDVVLLDLENKATGAYFPIALQNRPTVRVVTKDPFGLPIEGRFDMHALVRLEDGRLRLPAEFDLTSIEGVSAESVKHLKSSDIIRVEFSDDWLIRSVDSERAKGIHILDKIKEHVRQ